MKTEQSRGARSGGVLTFHNVLFLTNRNRTQTMGGILSLLVASSKGQKHGVDL